MYKTALRRTVFVSIQAILCGIAFTLVQAQTVPPSSHISFQVGLQAAQSGDALQALEHFQVLAAQGHDAAQYNLGLMYAHGLGVPSDAAQAQYWLAKSAAQNYTKAKIELERLVKY